MMSVALSFLASKNCRSWVCKTARELDSAEPFVGSFGGSFGQGRCGRRAVQQAAIELMGRPQGWNQRPECAKNA